MTYTLLHAFQSAKPDGSDATLIQPSNWNAAHVFGGGATGDLLVYDSAAGGKFSGVADVAVGQVLISGGVGAKPSWSSAPSVTAVSIGSTPAAAGTVRAPQGFQFYFRNNANSSDLRAMEGGRGNAGATANALTVGDSALVELFLNSGSGAVTLSGNIQTLSGDFVSRSSGAFYWASRSVLRCPADGNIRLSNFAETDFGLLQFGGNTSSFPALKRNGTTLEVKLADDSAFARLKADSLVAATSFQGPGTVAAAGDIRVQSAFSMKARNNGNSSDIVCVKTDSSDRVVVGDGSNDAGLVLAANGVIALKGTTSSFAALTTNTGLLQLRLADNSGPAGLANASLPAAGSAQNGIIGFDTTNNRFVFYVGGNRYFVPGTSF